MAPLGCTHPSHQAQQLGHVAKGSGGVPASGERPAPTASLGLGTAGPPRGQEPQEGRAPLPHPRYHARLRPALPSRVDDRQFPQQFPGS